MPQVAGVAMEAGAEAHPLAHLVPLGVVVLSTTEAAYPTPELLQIHPTLQATVATPEAETLEVEMREGPGQNVTV